MKSIQIYVQDNCPFCDEIIIPEGVNVEKIYINRDGFIGFKPGNVPVTQLNGMNFEGPQPINLLLNIIDNANDYKK